MFAIKFCSFKFSQKILGDLMLKSIVNMPTKNKLHLFGEAKCKSYRLTCTKWVNLVWKSTKPAVFCREIPSGLAILMKSMSMFCVYTYGSVHQYCLPFVDIEGQIWTMSHQNSKVLYRMFDSWYLLCEKCRPQASIVLEKFLCNWCDHYLLGVLPGQTYMIICNKISIKKAYVCI